MSEPNNDNIVVVDYEASAKQELFHLSEADCIYDHPSDSVGYGIISYHSAKSKTPKEEKPLHERYKENLIKIRARQKKNKFR